MPIQEHVDILRQGVKAWKEWRQKRSEVIPNLDGATLSYMDLREVNFSGASLREADLSGAILYRANLSDADLTGANITFAHLGDANLPAANLQGAYLTGASLRGAYLPAANLRGAHLHDAHLRRANLRRANLSDADLRDTNLSRADLSGANLSGAGLSGANLSGALLLKANFSGTVVGLTTFANNDLSTVKGLETVIHDRPSTIGVDTLFYSQGKIANVFLRGAGLPEDFIIYIPSLKESAINFYSCFISYSHIAADKSFARRLHDALQDRGIRCWLDEHQILPGHDIYAEVDRGIRLWDKVLLCCSKASLTSWWVDNEINSAFDKEQRLMKERGEKVLALIPLDLDGYLFSDEWKNGKAGQVKSRLAADFTGWRRSVRKFNEQFERVVKALRTDDGRASAPPPKL